MVYGDNRPFIVGLLVLNKDNFERFVVSLNLDPKDPEILTNKAVIRKSLNASRPPANHFRSMVYLVPCFFSKNLGQLKTIL